MDQSLGHQRQPEVVAGRYEDRLRQQSRRSFAASASTTCARERSRFWRRASITTRARPGRPTASASRSSAVPGTPFGQQAHQGSGQHRQSGRSGVTTRSTALRGGAAAVADAAAADAADAAATGKPIADDRPGLDRRRRSPAATRCRSGSPTWRRGEGKEFWHNQKDDKDFAAVNAIQWADADHVIFEAEPQEWARWYSVQRVEQPAATPVMLTPGDGAVEQTALSADGKFLFYATNAGDIERRHVWKVPTAGGAAEQLTKGETIETYPAALASGTQVAVLGGDAKRPFGVGLVPAAGGAREVHLSVARAVSDRRRSRAAAGADQGGRRHWRSTISCSCRRI